MSSCFKLSFLLYNKDLLNMIWAFQFISSTKFKNGLSLSNNLIAMYKYGLSGENVSFIVLLDCTSG